VGATNGGASNSLSERGLLFAVVLREFGGGSAVFVLFFSKRDSVLLCAVFDYGVLVLVPFFYPKKPAVSEKCNLYFFFVVELLFCF
jgi:hypothetical protein